MPRSNHAGDAPEWIGPYRILDTLGGGGMGTVYKAERRDPVVQLVALKVVKRGLAIKDVLSRFQLERRALAAMNHRSIAKVFDAGSTAAGEPYFVMELVEGLPLTDYCDKHRLSIPQRLALFQQVCAAVQHAHQKGVVHRDLKPGNVMVVREGDDAVPKVLDFGLAKATNPEFLDATQYTERDRILGTPEYMSPEQAAGASELIDSRADVYSLGVMLYELLTGQLPFPTARLREAGAHEAMRIIREDEPQKPSSRLGAPDETEVARRRRTSVDKLTRVLRGDLDWVVLKAMAKEPERRYDSATALAAELQRYLDSEPVLAGKPSAGYRLRKFVGKHRIEVGAALAVSVLLVAGSVGTGIGMVRAEANAREARVQQGIAAENARLATERAAEIERQKEDVAQRQARFDMLANVVHLRSAREREAALYPAWPEHAPALRDWLAQDAARLTEALPGLRETVEALRQRAVGTDEASAAHDAAAERLRGARARLSSLAGARAVARGEAPAAFPPLGAELAAADATALNEFAWVRVALGQERRVYGEEALALAAALRAVELVEQRGDATAPLHAVLDTLAWAYLAVGRTTDAEATSRRALAAAPETEREAYSGYLERIAGAGHHLAGAEGDRALARLTAEVSELDVRADTARTYLFASDSDAFLFDTLRELISEIESFQATTRAAVEQRLQWAETVRQASVGRFEERWKAARAAILAADGESASALYQQARIDLAPQIGLVPIGMNPVTKLWEFYDLRSAWDPAAGAAAALELAIPVHDAETGHIAVGESTGIVLVLLPGGELRAGAQAQHQGAPNFDPQSENIESPPHAVRLSPFFLARHELTQAQWARLSGGDQPSGYGHGSTDGLGGTVTLVHPVENVDWVASDLLLRRHGLMLPTEAQWEYGCRAGTTTPWWTGAERESVAGAVNLSDRTAADANAPWTPGSDCPDLRDGFVLHAPVDTLRPNPFGLHHVHGNVVEWCRDGYGIYTPQETDGDRPRPMGPGAAGLRVARGGSYCDAARDARSAFRGAIADTSRFNDLGVRAARPLRP